tara:strand:- start:72414 stop:74663 length:2250 start_codon:yes stop_codon:yes gene_type:complete
METVLNTKWANHRLLIIFILLFICGTIVISAINNVGKDVENNVDNLIKNQLPKVELIYQIQNHFKALELILYRYYETTDSDYYQRDWQREQQNSELLINKLAVDYSGDVKQYMVSINKIASALDLEMRQPSRDWDLIREHLAASREISRKFDMLVQQAATGLRDQFMQQKEHTKTTISRMILFQILFSSFVFIILLVVAILLKKRDMQNKIHRELALFPEQNPHPIFRLNREGQPLYLNPSAIRLAESLGLQHSPLRLLPANYLQEAKPILNTTSCYVTHDYSLGDRLFSASFHHREGIDSFYAYLVDVTERAKAEKELFHQANHDVLTGLPNRRRMVQSLDKKTAETHKPFSLLSIKAGRLYLIKASLGYEVSDRLLVAASKRLEQFVNDQIGLDLELFSFETGGWVVIVNNNSQPELAIQLSNQITHLFSSSLCIEDSELNLACTIGVTLFPQGGSSTKELLKNSDAALRQAFREAVNVRLYSDDLTQHANRWLVLEQGLKQALSKNEFSLNFQPKVHAVTGLALASEVLLRWQHKGQWISPAEFIPVSEDNGLIIAIGEWVLKQSCLQWVAWDEQGLQPHPIAVNVSAQQFMQSDFVELVAKTLDITGMPASKLELEITEEVASEYPEVVFTTMSQLKELGIKIAIDDFGTGYSSLSYLSRFPIDTLKIDRAFVIKMENSESDAAIVRMIMSLAQDLNLKVVAEGVETEQQQRILADLGCDYIQGFYFYRPMDKQQYQTFLTEQKR